MSPSMGPTDDLNSQTDYLSSQTEYTNSPTDSSKSSTYYLNSPRDYPSLTDSPSPAPTFGNTTASTTFTSSCQNGNLSHILACTSTIKPKPTTASSTAPIATSECVPCGGQNGTLPYCGADINTDYYRFTPKTCRTVRYDFDITNTTITPDGVSRTALVVNGQMPGPAIEANWGDTIIVTVNNKLTDNGTSIHFHGIRQFNSNQYDGVPSITQCPIAPGESMTYRWIADSYGTSWYHSHFALQTWMGVFGPIIIHGPTAKGYDVDAGTVMLQDWSHKTVDSLFPAAQKNGTGGPQIMDNGLINGMNTWGSESAANSTGRRFEWDATVVPGQTYLLRIVNAAIQSTYKFYIDGHTLEVISMDFTPIKPYKTKILKISIGQRYEVLVKADQPVGDYWMRSDNQNACGAVTTQAKDIKGIIRYVGSAGGTPTSTAYSYTDECTDEPMISLAPILSLSPTNKALEIDYNVTFGVNDKNMFKWYLENSTFESKYSSPTLLSFLENSTAHTVSNNLFLDLPNAGEWIYIVLESALNLPHPIHLHGHDFFIMAQGSGTYSPSTPLQFKNPPRRDTALMPGGGFLVIAFVTENPGAWLLHCHIGWHQSMGFALQILEMKGEIRGVSEGVKGSVGVMQDVCEKWRNWEDGKGGQNLNSPI
ncbi:hypothetical protein GQ43DRAFT_411263 [Delitschia confertaspora ATCC 74209]|uniref:Multicopper oxidase n=1 Tax=Delitschia confertaspora ATCC 74209 TaxID=1513339 RepID=A0A9P4MXV3_9PLEO|nr:hypothetical protein GQ43DRAFT_411263 [Delitschia confertaspora ATCC 74209]